MVTHFPDLTPNKTKYPLFLPLPIFPSLTGAVFDCHKTYKFDDNVPAFTGNSVPLLFQPVAHGDFSGHWLFVKF